MTKTIDLTGTDDMRSTIERIRRECRLNGYVVVDYDLDEYSDRNYVVIKKKRKMKSKPKPRFFA